MTSYAYQNRAGLPGQTSTVDSLHPSKRAFDAKDAEVNNGRPSSMVTKDRPHSAPHPSPDVAYETDRTAFNERWAQEQREARKAAFIAKRQHQAGLNREREHAPANNFNRNAVQNS